jgi:hypothetical protein
MRAEKFILRADPDGRLTGLPIVAAGEEVEVILLRREQHAAVVPVPQDLEQAYREANREIDPAWEVAAGDGLAHEAW